MVKTRWTCVAVMTQFIAGVLQGRRPGRQIGSHKEVHLADGGRFE